MDIKQGFELLGFCSAIMATGLGLIALVRRTDAWLVSHPRTAVAIVYTVIAVAVFLAGAMA